MLVLSRKLSQQILIGSDITITVVRIEGNHVRLGIEAPPGFRFFGTSWSPGRSEMKPGRRRSRESPGRPCHVTGHGNTAGSIRQIGTTGPASPPPLLGLLSLRVAAGERSIAGSPRRMLPGSG